MKNRVIVFIVEGISDKESLYGILSELYVDRNIVFSVVDGDITTDKYTSVSNIDSKLVSFIKKAMDKDKFSRNDIERVVHLVDTDGAYIPDSSIVYKDIKDPYYTSEVIETKDVGGIKIRNDKKRNILNKLSTMTSIFRGLKYDIYYMSCNLEHVLHDIQNANQEEKSKLAENLEDKFYDNPKEFINYMSSSCFTVKGEYKDTWQYIKNDTNSLKRYSNFHLFF